MLMATERHVGLIWGRTTSPGQRFFGVDFGRFALGVLLDALDRAFFSIPSSDEYRELWLEALAERDQLAAELLRISDEP